MTSKTRSKKIVSFLIVFILCLIFATFSYGISEKEVQNLIDTDYDLYKLYADNPQQLIDLLDEKPHLLNVLLSESSEEKEIRTHANPDSFDNEFYQKMLINAISGGKLIVNFGQDSIPFAFQNANIIVSFENGDKVGLVMRDSKIIDIQIGGIPEASLELMVSDIAFDRIFNSGSTFIEEIQSDEIKVISISNHGFFKTVGNAISDSGIDSESSSISIEVILSC